MHFIQEILYNLGIRHTVLHARPIYESDPEGGTLPGVKRLLTHYGVKVTAAYAEDHSLEGIPYPIVITHRGWPIVLKEPPKADSPIAKEWNGYLLLCDASQAHEPHYFSNRLKEHLQRMLPRGVMAATVLLAVAAVATGFGWVRVLWTLLSAVGLYFSLKSVQGECSGSCSRVTSSTGGKLLGLYPLSVIGTAWFILSLLVLLLLPVWSGTWSLLAVSAVAMPVWSIAYQAWVVHAWCRNCLAVQAVVLLTAALAIGFGTCTWSWCIATLLGLLYLPLFYLTYRAYLLYDRAVHPPMDPTLRRLIAHPQLREEIIRTYPSIDTSHAPAISLGGEGRELVTILSLHCTHCRDLFQKLYPLWQSGKMQQYHWSLMFSAYKNDNVILETILTTAQEQGLDTGLALLATWYEKFQRKSFQHLHTQLNHSDETRLLLSRQHEWLEAKRISSMPTIILDGHVLPSSLLEGMLNSQL